MSLFNFAYYREHGRIRKQRGPFAEPPFSVLSDIADPATLGRDPGYYFLAVANHSYKTKDTGSYAMDIAPVPGNAEGFLRLQIVTAEERNFDERHAPSAVDRGQWEVALNETKLSPGNQPAELYPFPTPFRAGFGSAPQYLQWRIPAGALTDGTNVVEVSYRGGRKKFCS